MMSVASAKESDVEQEYQVYLASWPISSLCGRE